MHGPIRHGVTTHLRFCMPEKVKSGWQHNPCSLPFDELHMTALPRAWRTNRLTASCAVLVLGLALAGWWIADRFASANRAKAVTALVQRCVLQMANNTCRVKNDSTNASAASRIFIAGVGEVDGAAYSEMQRWGEAMRENVRTQCQTAWGGASCQIAKALYPLVPL
jgi:hypothetical protein